MKAGAAKAVVQHTTEATSTPCPAAQARHGAPNGLMDPPAPSTEQLALAYRELWRHGWPTTLDAALQQHHLRVCITGLARNRQRKHLAAWPAHTLPRLPAPPTPVGVGWASNGRSEYSKAKGPATALGVWPLASPVRVQHRRDGKKAAANDLDD